ARDRAKAPIASARSPPASKANGPRARSAARALGEADGGALGEGGDTDRDPLPPLWLRASVIRRIRSKLERPSGDPNATIAAANARTSGYRPARSFAKHDASAACSSGSGPLGP